MDAIDYHEARNEWDRLNRSNADLTTLLNPADYESIGKIRFHQGRRGECGTCGGAGFIRFPFPVGHKWFGKAIPCPDCIAPGSRHTTTGGI